MSYFNEDQDNEQFGVFRRGPFNNEGGSPNDPFKTGVDYVGPMVDNPEPEGFLADDSVGPDQIQDGAITPGSLDSTPPAVPTALILTNSVVTMPDGSSRPTILARWNANTDTDLDGYEIEFDKAVLDPVPFIASASGSGGSLPAGTYLVQVVGQAAVSGETAASAAVEVPVTAGQRLFLTITAVGGMTGYRVFASRDEFPEFATTTTVTGTPVEITAEGTGAVAPTTSTALTFIAPLQAYSSQAAIEIESISPSRLYGARVRARDVLGNRSAFSTLATITSAKDEIAPEIPSNLEAVPGFRLVGLTWNRSPEIDLAYYQVRFALDDAVLPGTPDPTTWVVLQTLSNRIIVSDLSPDLTYHFEVRAVDRSDNVQTSLLDPTAVSATLEPEAGWTDPIQATPTLVGAADIAANSINANHITADGLDASIITTGFLNVGRAGEMSGFIIYNSDGIEIGRWDNTGLTVTDPSNISRKVRILNGVLEFSEDAGATWTTAISGQGIRADAIRLGTAPGGHNNLANSGFELAAFVTSLSKVWTSAADWGTTIGTDVNVTKTGTELKQTTYTY